MTVAAKISDGISRRGLLTGGLAGGFLLAFHLPVRAVNEPVQPPDVTAGKFAPNAFIRIDEAGKTTLVMPQVEMGQGVYTSIAMILAEELDADWSKVKPILPTQWDEKMYGNPLNGAFQTSASASVNGYFKPLRIAGAQARRVLIDAVAAKWNVPAAELGGTCVVGILQTTVELGGKALERTRFLPDRSGQPARDRVDEDHRRKVAVRQHVRPDRDRVRREMLHDALVESLEAGGQQSEPLLLRELLHDLLRQLTALRRQCDDTPIGHAAVDGVERGCDDIDPQDHPCAAAVRLVVHLRGAKRRGVAVREEPQVELGAKDAGDRTLLRQPGEGMRNQSEDVELHGRATQVS